MLLRDEHDPVLGAVGRGRRAPRRHHLLLLIILPLMQMLLMMVLMMQMLQMLLLMQMLLLILLMLMLMMLMLMDAPQSSLSESFFQYSQKVANYCIIMTQATQHFAIIRIKMA